MEKPKLFENKIGQSSHEKIKEQNKKPLHKLLKANLKVKAQS